MHKTATIRALGMSSMAISIAGLFLCVSVGYVCAFFFVFSRDGLFVCDTFLRFVCFIQGG